ncbi:hypothetical protein VZO05_03690 [Aggregatilineales bacterium SYSU G02658]
MASLHDILFNMQIIYSILIGVYAASLAARQQSISGNFWGTILIYAGLSGITLVVGIILALNGYRVVSGGRNTIYFLYMAFLCVIMPGLFSLLRGRDDRNAAIAFSLLALFNASVSISMFQRGLVTWALP